MSQDGVYFNEIDPFAAAWLRNLFPWAHVDERSIADVPAADVVPHRRCHFFAGIGGWEYALHLAGWPADRSVWTGSCPCQPFSCAGKRKGEDDPRHLWPAFRRLIAECKPATILGEQVASRAGREWLAGVRADLEGMGYAVGAADLCAAGAGAPHIRQRLFWVAKSRGAGRQGSTESRVQRWQPSTGGDAGGVDKPGGERRQRRQGAAEGSVANGETAGREQGPHGPVSVHETATGGLGNANGQSWPERNFGAATGFPAPCGADAARSGAWDAFDIVPCRDRKLRRIEPGTFPLAHGVPNRVGRLRGYGNAIVPQVAAIFIRAFMEVER